MQQHPGGGPVPLVGQLTDRASRRSPLFNSNNLLMGDAQSSLSIYCPDRQRQPSFDFFSGRGGHGRGCGRAGERSLFTRGERTSSSREGGGSHEFDGINRCSSRFSAMDVQHQSSKRPRPLSPPSSSERLAKVQMREASLDTSPRPSTIVASEESRFQTAPTTTETVQPALEDRQPAPSGFSHVPLSRNAVRLVKSLSRASTALTALLGLEKSLQPLCPSSAPPLSTSPLPLLRIQSSPVEESPGVPPPSAPSLQGATPTQAPPPSLGPHAVTPLSWAKVVGNNTQAPPPRRVQWTTT
jgi:hypothetical protein